MTSHNISILGQEVSFKTNADESRIQEAVKVIEQRFHNLNTEGSRMNSEKILLLVAISLADDYLQTSQKLENTENRVSQLLEKITDQDT